MIRRITFFTLLALVAMPAWAADVSVPAATPATTPVTPAAKKQPVQIDAAGQLEWLRAENKYRATKDVVITHGDLVIHGEQADASYDAAKGPSSLTQIVIQGPVTMVQKDRTITAQKDLQYFVTEHRAVATGHVEMKQGDRTLRAETVTAWFSPADNQLDHAVADGHVVLLRKTATGDDIAQGDHGTYDAVKDQAVLTGTVRIVRGENILQGARATMDMKTGYSRMENTGVPGARVRAVFTPGGGQ